MASTVIGDKEHRNFVIKVPQAENTRSEGTEVAMTQNTRLANDASRTKRSAFDFHHSKGSRLSGSGG